MTVVVLQQIDLLGEGICDLAILDGEVVPTPLETAPARRIDCRGLIALPGLVDLHTHLREPGRPADETIESGTRAAARGGYTAVSAMANTTPVADCTEVVEMVRHAALELGHCEVMPVGAVTRNLEGHELADIRGMAASSARVHLFSDDGSCVARSDVMRAALEAVRSVDGVLAQHAQDPLLTTGAQLNEGDISQMLGLPGWPAVAEEAIIARDCLLAAHLGARLHVCHVSTRGSVEVIRWAKRQGIPVTAEVTPHHLMLTDDLAATSDPTYKVNPPLRTTEDLLALRAGLIDGTIDAVATDHAPHSSEAKQRAWCDAPMGMLGLETALAVVADELVHAGSLSWADVADRMSIRPAAIAAASDRQGGTLQPGSAANIAIVDPNHQWTLDRAQLASRSSNTPFHGHEFRTRVVATVWAGTLTHDMYDLFKESSAPRRVGGGNVG